MGAVRVDGPDRQRRQLRGDAAACGKRASTTRATRRRCCSRSCVAAGFLGRKTRARVLRLRGRCRKPPRPATSSMRKRRRRRRRARRCRRSRRRSSTRIAGARRRRAAASARSTRVSRRRAAPAGGGAWLALTDGRTATTRASATRRARPRALRSRARLFDVRRDWRSRAADTCSDAGAFGAAAGALQAPGIAVSRLDDVAGLAVLRIVATLANEAADAVTQGVASRGRRRRRDAEGRQLSARTAARGPTRSASPGPRRARTISPRTTARIATVFRR